VYDDLADAEFERLLRSMSRIPDHDIYPVFEEGITRFEPQTSTQDYFLKQPNISIYKGNDDVAQLMLAEARANQRFLAHSHVNLGSYLGCVVHGGRIVSLAFPKYIGTLADRVSKARQLGPAHFPAEERERCINGIQSAVRHLHSLGYAHNDISACNIMFDSSGTAMLIDLDSCAPIGEKVKKGGVVGGWRGPFFWKQEFKQSSIECDELSLQYVQNWLISELSDKPGLEEL
jgi:serine/threonine protein kinase